MADRHEVGEVHEGPDRRQFALLGQAAQECLGRRPVLGRVHAEPAKDPTPGGEGGELAERRLADPGADRGLLGDERLDERRWGGAVADAGCLDDASDDPGEPFDDRGFVTERGHRPSIACGRRRFCRRGDAPTGDQMLTFTKADTLAEIRRIGLIAVLRAPSEELALGMVDALVAGGVTGIEVTYSTPNAPDVVRALGRITGRASCWASAR